LIQAQRDLVELRLRMDGEVGASREVLPQQQIGVFVGPALPGTLWIAEVDLHIRRYREVFVLGSSGVDSTLPLLEPVSAHSPISVPERIDCD
jgi:hypothetical protein